MTLLKRWLLNIVIVLDNLGNVLAGGSPDETISARAARNRYTHPRTWGRLARLLDWIQGYHSSKALDDDLVRAEAEVEREQQAGEAQAAAVNEQIERQREKETG